MEKVIIFGHKNPDTDTICSAIAYADLKKQLGAEAEPVRLGEVSGETQFALDTFNMKAPRQISSVKNENVEGVILVDHNERQQSADDIDDVRVLEVIDHHRISNFETQDPLYYRAEPVGCTATILNKMYKEKGKAIPKDIAGLMLSAIISDTLLFKSPTCTEEDVAAGRELAEIAGVDADSYGLDMLKAGADISDKTVEQLISLDSKEFAMHDHKVEIAQVNVVDQSDVLERKPEIEAAMSSVIEEKNLDLFMFTITNILTNDSVAIALGKSAEVVDQAYEAVFEDNMIALKGVVSRKKQIVPVLTDAFKNL